MWPSPWKKKERQDCGHQCLMGASLAITIQLRVILVLLIFAGFLVDFDRACVRCCCCLYLPFPPMLTVIGFYLPANVRS